MTKEDLENLEVKIIAQIPALIADLRKLRQENARLKESVKRANEIIESEFGPQDAKDNYLKYTGFQLIAELEESEEKK